ACGLRAFKWHGDVGQKEKLAALHDPPELLLTTPESLEAIFLRKSGWRELFHSLLTVIIDEAHNFAAGPRGGHLASLLARLERGSGSRQPPQAIAVSATVGNPEALLRWLAGGHRRPGSWISVAPAARADRDFRVCYFPQGGDTEATPPNESADV